MKPIVWRVHLASAPERVYRMLATDDGRTQFWAERSMRRGDAIEFRFPDGTEIASTILEEDPPHTFSLTYFGGSRTTFRLHPDGRGGCDLELCDEGVPAEHWEETHAGWISVLLALKAACDHGIDLRNHDPRRSWAQGYCDN